MPIMDAEDKAYHNYGMLNAFVASCRSADRKTKLGACILNKDKKIVGEGTNHFPPGLENMAWQNDENHPDYKYNYVIFAVHEAIFNASETKGCILYTNMFPSVEDSKLIVLSGIDTVVYFPRDPTRQEIVEDQKITRSILKAGNVNMIELNLTKVQRDVASNILKVFAK